MAEALKDRLPAAKSSAVVKAEDEKPTAAVVLRRVIDGQTEAFKAILPAGDAERFSRLVLTAVKATPKLMEAFGTTGGQQTVLLSAMQCAALGLEPNTPTQDAWLLPRWNGQTKSMECELSIGYRGLLKLARRAGGVKDVFAEVVYQRDEFDWSRGLEKDHLHHRPFDGDGDAGEITHAYAVVRFLNGGVQLVVMNMKEILKRRAMSSSWSNEKGRSYSPWTKWFPEMCRKTVLRDVTKYLELSTEDARGLQNDEARLRFNEDEGVIDAVSTPAGELAAAPEVEGGAADREEAGAGSDDSSHPGAVTTTPPSSGVGGREGVQQVRSPEGETSSPADAPPADNPNPMSEPQNKALHALLKRKMDATGDARFPVLSDMLDRPVTSTKEISFSEASTLIDTLNELGDHQPEAGL